MWPISARSRRRTSSTDSNGHASLHVHRAAPPPASHGAGDNMSSIVVTPVGPNYRQTTLRSRSVRNLVWPGRDVDRCRPGRARRSRSSFFSPTAPRENDTIHFDASASPAGTSVTGAGQIVSFAWTFGDGGSADGRAPELPVCVVWHLHGRLTVTDNRGSATASTSQPSPSPPSADPTIVLNVSPSSPVAGSPVSMTAAGSKASPGHTINGYDWDFGDGSAHGSGISVTHTYAKAGAYTVVVTVFDDQGRSTTGTLSVSVVTSGPTASFTYTPTSPTSSSGVLQCRGVVRHRRPHDHELLLELRRRHAR